ncbi:MAG: O-methyltransferase [Thermomicrobiales bacterium]
MPLSEEAQRVLDRLYAEDQGQRAAGLPSSQRTRNVEKESGRFLHLLVLSMRAKTVFEIGSSNGVSTIWLASALAQTGGFMLGTEILPDRAAAADQNLADANLSQCARVMPVDARDLLKTFAGDVDFVFIDAEKDDYSDHFLSVIDKVRAGGVIVADNVISHDCSAYQAMLRTRIDVETLTLPLERGLEFTVKKWD